MIEGMEKIVGEHPFFAGLDSDTIALIALASGLEIGVVLMTLDEDLVNRYGHNH